MKKNIFIFNEISRASNYGIGTYIEEVIKLFTNNRSYNINIVTLFYNEEFKIVNNNNINFWFIPTVAYSPEWNDLEKKIYFKQIVRLIKIHSNFRKYIFHINYMSLPLIEELKANFKCVIICAIHYFDWCLRIDGNSTHFKSILKKKKTDNYHEQKIKENFITERKIFENSDYILCLSIYTSNILKTIYEVNANKLEIIYNPLSDSFIKYSKKEIITLKKKYHFNGNEKIILFVGRLDDIKGLDILIEAFKIVIEKEKNCRLIIIGEGAFEKFLNISKDIWSKITFTGRLAKEEVYNFYSIANIGVLPSKHEQCSYTAIEMMMHGLPMIVTESTGLTEMIENGVHGYTIPIKEHADSIEISKKEIAEKILLIFKNDVSYRSMKKNIRKRYLNTYHSNIIKKRYLKLYNKCILY